MGRKANEYVKDVFGMGRAADRIKERLEETY